MNIALAIFHADPARGGAERYTIDLAGAIAAQGQSVSLLASSFGTPPPRVQAVPLAAGGITRLGRYESFLASLDAHLAGTPYDIVHAMLPVGQCDLYHPHAGVAADALATGHCKHRGRLARSAARLLNSVNLKRRRFAAVERALLTGPNPPVVLCLSEYVKAAVRRHYPLLPDDRLATLFNAVNLNRFNPSARPAAGDALRESLGIPSNRIIALMIAQDFARKGLAEAIEALAAVNDPRLVLIVVGKEPPGPYRSLAQSRNVADSVIFAGSTADPYAFYQLADFFVLPTRHDPCSLVVLEALAMGLPVISTRQNGATEIMTPGQEGFILGDPSDVPALASAIRTILGPDIRTAMRDASLRLRPRLSEAHHVARLLEIYDTIRRTKGGACPSPTAAAGETRRPR